MVEAPLAQALPRAAMAPDAEALGAAFARAKAPPEAGPSPEANAPLDEAALLALVLAHLEGLASEVAPLAAAPKPAAAPPDGPTPGDSIDPHLFNIPHPPQDWF